MLGNERRDASPKQGQLQDLSHRWSACLVVLKHGNNQARNVWAKAIRNVLVLTTRDAGKERRHCWGIECAL
jgi:hypothetical protein